MASVLPARSTRRIRQWASVWGVPELAAEITIEISSRLRTTLGRCHPQTGEIRIAAFLLEGPEALLEEVICHELAHVAASRLHGRGVRPHGPEWRQLMRDAGYAPRARLSARELERLPEAARRARGMWEHRCPRCGARRDAGRPVPSWRCAACRAAGRSGDLLIEQSPRRDQRPANSS